MKATVKDNGQAILVRWVRAHPLKGGGFYIVVSTEQKRPAWEETGESGDHPSISMIFTKRLPSIDECPRFLTTEVELRPETEEEKALFSHCWTLRLDTRHDAHLFIVPVPTEAEMDKGQMLFEMREEKESTVPKYNQIPGHPHWYKGLFTKHGDGTWDVDVAHETNLYPEFNVVGNSREDALQKAAKRIEEIEASTT